MDVPFLIFCNITSKFKLQGHKAEHTVTAPFLAFIDWTIKESEVAMNGNKFV